MPLGQAAAEAAAAPDPEDPVKSPPRPSSPATSTRKVRIRLALELEPNPRAVSWRTDLVAPVRPRCSGSAAVSPFHLQNSCFGWPAGVGHVWGADRVLRSD